MLGPLALGDIVSDPKELRKRIRDTLKTSDALIGAKGRFYAVGGAWRYEMFGRKAIALLSGKLAVSFNGGQVRLFDV